MKWKTIIGILTVLLTATAHIESARDLVRIVGANRDEVRTLEKLGAIVNYVDARGVVAEATPDEQKKIRNIGYTVEIITPNISKIYEQNFLAPATDGRYLTYPEFRDTMAIIAQNNPNICKLETLGLSYNGNLILAMKISDNPQINEDEPVVHFEGAIHGDEKIGWAIVFELLKYLVRNYGTDTIVTRMVDNREIYLLPMYNPDGYSSNPASRYNGNGVDLNRNWGWMWGNEVSQGATPFSEPENRAVLAHIWRNPAVTYVSYHAGTTFISHPWSYCSTYVNTIPELPLIQFLSARYDAFTHYTYGQGADSMYPINGSTKDFDYGYGMMGWSIEVHIYKTPPASEIDPTFNLNKPAMFALMHHAGQGIRGTVTDAETNEPVPCQIWVSPARWLSYNDPALGDFHRFYLPGTYQITFLAPGYRETTLTDVVVPDFGDSVTTVDVQLTSDPSAPLFAFRHIYNNYVNPALNRTYPVRALGPHDGEGFRLDNGKYICLDMQKPIRNQEGMDLIVYRSAGTDSALIQGANSWLGPWINIGTARTNQSLFDIGAVGLDSVRYIKVTAWGEFHLDAIEDVKNVGISSNPSAISMPLAIKIHQNPTKLPVRFTVNQTVQNQTLKIYDKSGRMVTDLPLLNTTLVWDGKDRKGKTVSPGVYFARFEVNSAIRIIITR
ncbi:MAG: M14 family zinc carboxypeptidase [candidate division WOR-3 bacterium]